MSNVLDLYDQAYFSFERAAGVTCVLQCVWVYNRTIDIDGLRQFHNLLQQGRLSRRIERSPVPFGRHRWVSPNDHSKLEIVQTPCAREGFDAWVVAQANTRLDTERGPGWHLAVLPFTDGGAGVSLVVSHCLTDGVGLCEALADAATGHHNSVDWPAAGSRRRWQALAEDTRQSARDTAAIGKAVLAAAQFAGRHRGRAGSATVPVSQQPAVPPAPTAGADERVTLSTATIFVDAKEWDSRADSLGGTSNTLLAGLAARLALRAGRLTADGLATPSIPVNERTPGDTRANAITNVDITVDPALAATDLREIRAATKQALIRHQQVPDDRWALLPLVPLLPQRWVRNLVRVATGGTTNVVSSNLGAAPAGVNRADGTDADYFAMKSLYPGVTRAIMHRTGGVLALLSGRVDRQVFVSALAYQPGRSNSNDDLWRNLASCLGDFSLTATTGWPCPIPADVLAGQANPSELSSVTA
ncbi:MAG TPA: wax ester/triacylglycerol synthase domain-containing protein [Mycobacterium sp.]|nr:wax ester/triacylglycerol synthase domain-containing protein [Mycobacterium sp.]HTX97527.1 wax ester/triacylglycerol synthase domain-containing protein [Mycobacterium sp.]